MQWLEINDQIKQKQLSSDLKQCLCKVCCLQETKMRNGCDKYVQDYRLICLPSTKSTMDKVLCYTTARKMCKYEDFSGPCFHVFNWNTGKYGPEKTPHLNTFSAVHKIIED